jgi:adenine-specific DNA methylase
MLTWEDYFTPRQGLALATLVGLLRRKRNNFLPKPDDFADAAQTCLALAIDRQVDFTSSLCSWWSGGEKIQHTFAKNAFAMVWDYVECNPWSGATGDWGGAYEWGAKCCEHVSKSVIYGGNVAKISATTHPLPNESVFGFVTDPPYYYSIQYADLSDFFFVWLRRSLGQVHHDLLGTSETPKADEIIVQSPGHEHAAEGKNNAFYESRMKKAMAEGKRLLSPLGLGVVVFAHKSTGGWEAMLQAMIDSGWILTASWPIDTEMATRTLAHGRATLASSVHLVCRPRPVDRIGDWRDVLAELPKRIHDWMPRLASEAIVGADAIFACLGPALEIFSRYSRVETAAGVAIPLGDVKAPNGEVIKRGYLSYVWEVVAKEALSMIFTGADATGFEPDARLTAMWLWTLSTGANGNGAANDDSEEEADEDEESSSKPSIKGGFVLEYDAARKIAQGLGAHLEQMPSVAEVRGDKARLLPVSERARHLFGKDEGKAPAKRSPGAAATTARPSA